MALVPDDGWIDGDSNALGVQGAVYAAADGTTYKTLESTITGSLMCMRGAAARIDLQCTPPSPAVDCFQYYWGARLGVNLNQADVLASLMPYDASAFVGFSFDIVGPTIPSHVQFSVEASDGTFYCIRRPTAPGGSWEVDLDDLVRDCHQAKPNAPNASSAKSAFAALHWTVIGKTNDSVPFDFCVENLRVHLE